MTSWQPGPPPPDRLAIIAARAFADDARFGPALLRRISRRPKQWRPVIQVLPGGEERKHDNVKAAARSCARRTNSIRQAIERGGLSGGCRWFYANLPREQWKSLTPRARNLPVIIEGKTYRNARDAAHALGIPWWKVSRMILSGEARRITPFSSAPALVA